MKKKITAYIFLVATLGILLASLASSWSYWKTEVSATSEQLQEYLNLMDVQGDELENWVAQMAVAVPSKRITMLTPVGEVIVDSTGLSLDSHADRPEVVQVLETGQGESLRKSDTTGVMTLYRTMFLENGNIGRVAMPMADIQKLVWQSVVRYLSVSVVVLVVLFLLSRKLASLTTRPLELEEEKLSHEELLLQEARAEFAGNVSHELKTPLTSIKGFTDMLASGMVTDPEAQSRFITMIGVEADRLIDLINDVLKISELESVIIPHADECCDVMEVVGETIDFLRPYADKHQVAVHVTGEQGYVPLTASRLRELVSNLIENAIKYNEPEGNVTVSVVEEGTEMVITVSDTGIGIPEEHQQRIFERFYRVDKGRARSTGGTGLGLAIVKHITRLYGGNITLHSKPEQGTTFVLRLPKL